MKKNEKRFHSYVDNYVASVYFTTTYLDKCIEFNNGTEVWNYDTVGVCVSRSKRLNNDWYNGDKVGLKLHNRSTGNIKTITAIVDIIETHLINKLTIDGIAAIEFEPTDEHRAKAYKKMMHRFVNKYNVECLVDVTDNCYFYVLIA